MVALALVLLAGSVRPQLAGPETVAAIQIHGNLATSDDDILRLADVHVGMPVAADTVDVVTMRLRATRRFDRVDVLKRFASIADPTQIVLVIIVDEGPVHVAAPGSPGEPARVVRTRGPDFLYLPILGAEDGYGLTYGVRMALPDAAGPRTRISFPLSWGGEKKAGAEFEKSFEDARATRVLASAAVQRRTNPYFQEDDDRQNVWVRGEREIARGLRAGGTAAWSHVSFMGARESFAQAGADIVYDTRLDAVLPRNAVYARAAWDHLSFATNSASRSALEARGYVGLFRQNILALRVQRDDSNVPLPPYLKPLLGGMDSVRGIRAGSAIGDTLVAASAEVIVPLTSPVSFGRFGVSVFTDAGTVYDKGERLADQDWRRGYGASLWFAAAVVRVSVAVAHGVGGPATPAGPASSTRVHVSATIAF